MPSCSGGRQGELKSVAFPPGSEMEKPRSAGNLGQCVPHTSVDSPTHSSLHRLCRAEVLQPLTVPRVFPGLPCFPAGLEWLASASRAVGALTTEVCKLGVFPCKAFFMKTRSSVETESLCREELNLLNSPF